MITPLVLSSVQLDLGGDGVVHALHVDEGVLHHAGHAGIDRERLAPAQQVGPAGDGRVEALGAAVVDRQHVVALGLLQEDRLQLLELLGILRGEVVRLAEVLVDVVELPHVVLQRRESATISHGIECRVQATQPSW